MRKYVIIGIGLFLAALFLTTVGNLITGYSAYKIDGGYSLKDLPAPFIKNNAYNGFYIVLGERYSIDELNAAKTVAKKFQAERPLAPPIVFPVKYSSGYYGGNMPRIPDFYRDNGNLILIGDSCTNQLIRKYISSGSGSCSSNLKKNQGMIKFIEENAVNAKKRSVIIVSGYSTKDIVNAADIIANYNNYPLRGNAIYVEGNPKLGPKYTRLTFSKS